MSLVPGGKKKYTLNDIAKELGVNKATVSKAISGKGNLSAETISLTLWGAEEDQALLSILVEEPVSPQAVGSGDFCGEMKRPRRKTE